MNKKLLTFLLIILTLVGGVVLYWDEVLGMLGIGGASTLSLNKGLIAHLPMSQDTLRSSTSMGDISSNAHHGTITPGASAGFVADQHGQATKAYDFDAVNNGTKVSLASSSTMFNPYTDEFTISFWFRPDWNYTEDVEHSFLSGGTGYFYATTPWFTILKRQNGNGNAFVMDWGTGQTNLRRAEINNPTFFQAGQWVHIVWTKTGTNSVGTEKLYANGILQTLSAWTDGTISSAPTFSNNYYFGGDPANSSGTDGRVSDLRIYKRALSQAEVTLLAESYNPKLSTSSLEKGLTGHWELGSDDETLGAELVTNTNFETDLTGWNNGSVVSFTTAERNTTSPISGTGDLHVSVSGAAGDLYTTFSLTSGKRYQLTWTARETSGILKFAFVTGDHYGGAGWSGTSAQDFTSASNTNYSYAFTSGATGTAYLHLYSTTGGEGYVDNVSMKELQTADSTPNRYHGSISPGASAGYTTDRKGQAGKAYDFDGADTEIGTGSDFVSTGADSFSFWMYLDSYGQNSGDPQYAGVIVSNSKTAALLDQTNQRFLFTSNNNLTAVTANGSILTGQWYHAVVTRNASGTANWYINGALSGSANQASGAPEAGTTNVSIGNTLGFERHFDGKISDVRIWNRVLSTSEITQLYESYNRKISTSSLQKGLIAHYPMKTKYYNATTTRMDDTTPSAYHGTFTAGSGSVTATYTDFDGANTYVDLGADFIGTGADSISAWIYADSLSTSPIIIGGEKTYFGVELANSRLYFSSNNGTVIYSANNSISTGQWYHVAVTRTSEGVTNFYVNGSLSGTANQTGNTPTTGSYNVRIGHRFTSANWFDGRITNLRVYNRVLSADEVALLYQFGK